MVEDDCICVRACVCVRVREMGGLHWERANMYSFVTDYTFHLFSHTHTLSLISILETADFSESSLFARGRICAFQRLQQARQGPWRH